MIDKELVNTVFEGLISLVVVVGAGLLVASNSSNPAVLGLGSGAGMAVIVFWFGQRGNTKSVNGNIDAMSHISQQQNTVAERVATTAIQTAAANQTAAVANQTDAANQVAAAYQTASLSAPTREDIQRMINVALAEGRREGKAAAELQTAKTASVAPAEGDTVQGQFTGQIDPKQ